MKCLGGQICFTIIPDSLIDSIEETIDHIHCENTSRRIFDQSFFSVTLWAVGRSENLWGPEVMDCAQYSHLVEIGLTDLQKSGDAIPPGTTTL